MRKIIIYLALLPIFLNSCLENPAVEVQIANFENTALLLKEIEDRGDYTNTSSFPAIINAEDVYNEISNCILIDVRSPEIYSQGHITNAVNIFKENLFDHIIDTFQPEKKYVLISGTGEAAAFYTSLFRIYGLTNIYSLNFGMAGWNKDFSNNILSFAGDFQILDLFNNINEKKPPVQNLPALVKDENSSTAAFLDSRIKSLFLQGFEEATEITSIGINSTRYNGIIDLIIDSTYTNDMIICYGDYSIYYFKQLGMLENPGHPRGSYLYTVLYPTSEMSSTKYLQTLPTNKNIYLYSFSGQISAMGTAYLKILGYNAKSILIGAHTFFYSRFSISEALMPFGYNLNNIPDYPYIIE